eukprot:9287365-Alexandrium_andersonii.AAC.1
MKSSEQRETRTSGACACSLYGLTKPEITSVDHDGGERPLCAVIVLLGGPGSGQGSRLPASLR